MCPLSVESQVIASSPSQEISKILVQIRTTGGYIDLHSLNSNKP